MTGVVRIHAPGDQLAAAQRPMVGDSRAAPTWLPAVVAHHQIAAANEVATKYLRTEAPVVTGTVAPSRGVTAPAVGLTPGVGSALRAATPAGDQRPAGGDGARRRGLVRQRPTPLVAVGRASAPPWSAAGGSFVANRWLTNGELAVSRRAHSRRRSRWRSPGAAHRARQTEQQTRRISHTSRTMIWTTGPGVTARNVAPGPVHAGGLTESQCVRVPRDIPQEKGGLGRRQVPTRRPSLITRV